MLKNHVTPFKKVLNEFMNRLIYILLVLVIFPNQLNADNTIHNFLIRNIIHDKGVARKDESMSELVKLSHYKEFVLIYFSYWYHDTIIKDVNLTEREKIIFVKQISFFGEKVNSDDKQIMEILLNYRSAIGQTSDELLAWYQLISFPIQKEDFMSLERYQKLVDDFYVDFKEYKNEL